MQLAPGVSPAVGAFRLGNVSIPVKNVLKTITDPAFRVAFCVKNSTECTYLTGSIAGFHNGTYAMSVVVPDFYLNSKVTIHFDVQVLAVNNLLSSNVQPDRCPSPTCLSFEYSVFQEATMEVTAVTPASGAFRGDNITIPLINVDKRLTSPFFSVGFCDNTTCTYVDATAGAVFVQARQYTLKLQLPSPALTGTEIVYNKVQVLANHTAITNPSLSVDCPSSRCYTFGPYILYPEPSMEVVSVMPATGAFRGDEVSITVQNVLKTLTNPFFRVSLCQAEACSNVDATRPALPALNGAYILTIQLPFHKDDGKPILYQRVQVVAAAAAITDANFKPDECPALSHTTCTTFEGQFSPYILYPEPDMVTTADSVSALRGDTINISVSSVLKTLANPSFRVAICPGNAVPSFLDTAPQNGSTSVDADCEICSSDDDCSYVDLRPGSAGLSSSGNGTHSLTVQLPFF
jgi:hypothetical protein